MKGDLQRRPRNDPGHLVSGQRSAPGKPGRVEALVRRTGFPIFQVLFGEDGDAIGIVLEGREGRLAVGRAAKEKRDAHDERDPD